MSDDEGKDARDARDRSRDNAPAVRAKVAEIRKEEAGKGILRLGRGLIRALALDPESVVEVSGKRTTGAIPLPAYPEDEGLEVVRMDGLVRANAGVAIGDTVELRKVEPKEARKVVLAPAKQGLRIAGSGDALKPTLMGRPVSPGDVVSTSAFQGGPPPAGEFARDDLFRAFFHTRAFGLMEIRLVVVSTSPKGIVRVGAETEIELSPEYTEAIERAAPDVTYDDLGGLKDVVGKVREMIELPLRHPELFDRLGIDPPKGVLLFGPPGTGKTLLAKAVANECDTHFAAINGPEIMGKFYGESEQRLREVFETAAKNAPAIIFIDELDSIAPRRAEVTGEVERRIVAQLLTLMDGLQARRNVIVIGATNRVDAIDPALRRPGRFDREIEIRIPDEPGRLEILHIHTRGMPLEKDVDLQKIAEVTRGYTGSDIAALAREAALATLRRALPEMDPAAAQIPKEVLDKLTVTVADLDQALREVQPSALREIMIEIPNVRWDDIGGLEDAKRSLRETIELPLKHPDAFQRLGIRAPKGVLLYGPPGTGKTMIAKAVATEAGANFLTAKGSALLSKWYGESEKKIAEFFKRARQVAPSILFLDELDSLAPVRGGAIGDNQVTERVVNQLLAEMDGLEELRGVAILGATNRPDMLDPALLRPGRLDELVYIPVPDRNARVEIFRVHTRRMALEPGVDLDRLAEVTERFTGADIAGACTKAGLLALREDPEAKGITLEHFFRAIQSTIPSVSPDSEREYEKVARKVKQQTSRIGFLAETPERAEP